MTVVLPFNMIVTECPDNATASASTGIIWLD